MECITFHLLTVFCNDAAKAQRYYIRNGLKKPKPVPIRQFVQHIQQQNDYLELLPCLYQSSWTTPVTKKVRSIDAANLAGYILCMCPGTWQAQYKLKAKTVPQCICNLLDDLKKIKKAFLTEHNQSAKKGKTNPSKSNKRKMVLFNKPIPKKACRVTKHCALCKKHGGAHTTLNTSDCRKYEKVGKLKNGFSKGQHGNTALDGKPLVHLLSFQQRLKSSRRQTRSLRKAPRSRA